MQWQKLALVTTENTSFCDSCVRFSRSLVQWLGTWKLLQADVISSTCQSTVYLRTQNLLVSLLYLDLFVLVSVPQVTSFSQMHLLWRWSTSKATCLYWFICCFILRQSSPDIIFVKPVLQWNLKVIIKYQMCLKILPNIQFCIKGSENSLALLWRVTQKETVAMLVRY